jgi:hypothetical protein
MNNDEEDKRTHVQLLIRRAISRDAAFDQQEVASEVALKMQLPVGQLPLSKKEVVHVS